MKAATGFFVVVVAVVAVVVVAVAGAGLGAGGGGGLDFFAGIFGTAKAFSVLASEALLASMDEGRNWFHILYDF